MEQTKEVKDGLFIEFIDRLENISEVNCIIWDLSVIYKRKQRFNKFSYLHLLCLIQLCCFFVHPKYHPHFLSRVFWKLCNSTKSLPESWAWGLHWLSQDTQELFVSAIAVPLYSFSQHNGSISRNYLFLVVSNFPLTFQSFPYHELSFVQDLPVQKQSDYVQDFYQSFAEYFKSEYKSVQLLMCRLSWKYDGVESCLNFCFQVFLTLRSLR